MTSKFKDLVRMNPSIFISSKVIKDQQEFLDGVYNLLCFMDVSNQRVTPRRYGNLKMQHNVLDLSEVFHKTFNIIHRIHVRKVVQN